MPPVVTTAEIDRQAAEVFAVATDPARFKEWQKGVVDGHMVNPDSTARPPGVGAKCVMTRRIGGADRPSTSELVRFNPPETWGVRGTDGPIRAAVDVQRRAGNRLTIPADHQRRLHRIWHRQAPDPAHGPP